MIIYLRYNTDSQTRKLPVFVDSTDGDSEETGLTIANTDILIGKPGGTTLTAKHSGGATHISNGIYYATFDSSDSDTVGNGELYIHKSGALYVFATLVILPVKVYDSLFLGSDNLEVDIVQLLGTAWLTPAVAGTPDVNAKTVADKTGYSGSGTVTDKTGFSLSVTPPTASQIDTQLSGTHGSGAWGAASVGSSTYPAADDPFLDNNGDPVEGVTIECYSSSDYSAGSLVQVVETDINGLWEFHLNPGTYYFRAVEEGYDWAVDGGDNEWSDTVN